MISIHALLAESDVRGEHHANSQQEFLSTLSLRRATLIFFFFDLSLNYNFYPRSPCGERRVDGSGKRSTSKISIHALLAESDEIMQIITP